MSNHDDDPPARPAAETRPPSPPRPRGRTARPRLDRAAQARLGQSLRLYYASLTEQPVPERFTRLLEEMSDTSATRRGA